MQLEMPPPAPRPFRLRAVDAHARFLMMFGAVWLAVGGIISVAFTAGGGPFWDDIFLDRRGVTAPAKMGLMEPTNSSVNGRLVHRITYVFADRDGVERSGTGSTTDPATFYGHQELTIQYDPLAPTRTRLAGGSASFFGLFVLFPLAFALVGAIVIGFGLRRAAGARAIYVHGHAVQATVTAVLPSAMWNNRRPVMRVEYAFETIMGRATGSTSALEPPPVGSPLWVLHLPSDPRRNVAV